MLTFLQSKQHIHFVTEIVTGRGIRYKINSEENLSFHMTLVDTLFKTRILMISKYSNSECGKLCNESDIIMTWLESNMYLVFGEYLFHIQYICQCSPNCLCTFTDCWCPLLGADQTPSCISWTKRSTTLSVLSYWSLL